MSTAQPSKNPGVRGSASTVKQTTHATNTYQNKGAAPKHMPRGQGC
jgi:hypothetical protein